MAESCPLCSIASANVFYGGKLVVGLWADHATTPGHAILTTRRHVADWFAASPAEQRELTEGITIARDVILEEHRPDGFNIGIRVGNAAGQVGDHLRIDVVPRYRDPASARVIAAQAAQRRKTQPAKPLAEPKPAPAPAPAASKAHVRLAEVGDHPAAAAAAEEPQWVDAEVKRRTESSAGHDDDREPTTSYPYADDARVIDDFDDFEAKLPKKRGRWVVLLLLILAGGGGYAGYRYYNSPYIGDGPASLKVEPKSKTNATTEKAANATPGAGSAGSGSGSAIATSGSAATAGSGSATAAGSGSGDAASSEAGSGSGSGSARHAKLSAADAQYDKLVARAEAAMAKRRSRSAYKLYSKALTLKPDGWQALQRLAWRDCKVGRLKRARTRASLALQGNPKAAYAHLALGVVAHERGRRREAREGYRMFLSLCPRCREAREIRSSLRSLGRR